MSAIGVKWTSGVVTVLNKTNDRGNGMKKSRIGNIVLVTAVACGLILSGAASAQEKLTVWWVKGFYKSEDDALFAALKKYEDKTGAADIYGCTFSAA
jgi:hypothetical protein